MHAILACSRSKHSVAYGYKFASALAYPLIQCMLCSASTSPFFRSAACLVSGWPLECRRGILFARYSMRSPCGRNNWRTSRSIWMVLSIKRAHKSGGQPKRAVCTGGCRHLRMLSLISVQMVYIVVQVSRSAAQNNTHSR